MLSISQPITGASCGDYYTSGGGGESYYVENQCDGKWFGKGADKLNLKGRINAAEFQHLLSGFDPRGKRPLVLNAGHSKRQCGWDLTFSAPKSVSILWASEHKLKPHPCTNRKNGAPATPVS